MGIHRLPSAVVSFLRTDVTVTTTAQCVAELVLNSIDAAATAIAVRIDLKNFRIQVVDNGCGLSNSDLIVIGTRYMTSKCNSLHDLQTSLHHYGFRGEALASITEVCGTLTIVSRSHDSEETYCKVFTQGVAHPLGKSHQQRPSCGTTITVADFLHNRPVRRARIKPALDIEEIKTHMESIALINPHVSFSLRNDINNELILQTRRAEDIPTVFGTLFGESMPNDLVPVKECNGPFKIEGYISKEAHLLKKYQFIYVNKRLLLKTKIHKLVNSVMSRSAIIKSNNGQYVPISKEINHDVFLAFSPPKKDKHAVFVLNITCPLSEYDITLDPKKTLVEFCNWDCLLSCFENLLRKFIEKETGIENNAALESDHPKNANTIVDEMNQLAREEALGTNIMRPTEGSISTRDLSRAIHGLPVSRHQVNLSASPSPRCLPSTTSSDLTRLTNGVVMSSIPSSAFTEKPWPCNLRIDHLSSQNAESTRTHDPFLTETEVSITTHVTPKSQLPGKFKLPSKPLPKQERKGFITDTICFKECFRKVPDILPGRINDKMHEKVMIPSPINALASIKEIRRKKLLNNLSKFSYKMECEKPLLNKTVLSAAKANIHNIETKIAHQRVPNMIENHEENHSLKESRAMQTNFPEVSQPVANYLEPDLHPASPEVIQYEKKQQKDNLSTDVNATNLPSLNSNRRMKKSIQGCRFENSIEEAIVMDVNKTTVFSFGDTSVIPTRGSDIQSISQEYKNIMSVEDLLVTSHDLRQIHSSSLQNKCGSSNLYFQNLSMEIDDNHFSPSICIARMDAKKSNARISVDPNSEMFALDTRETPQETCSVSGIITNCDDVNKEDPVNSKSITVVETQASRTKIVDYDSSPSSSQETFQSSENLIETNSSSPNKLKRKLNGHSADCNKKAFVSFKESKSECNENLDNELILGNNNHSASCSIFSISLSTQNDNMITDAETECATRYELISNQSGSSRDNVFQNKSALGHFVGKEKCAFSNCEDSGKIHDPVVIEEILKVENTVIQDPCPKFSSCSLANCEEQNTVWMKEVDQSGKPFYIHRKSGITTYKQPRLMQETDTFQFNERLSFLPKGMSPILQEKLTIDVDKSPNITCEERNIRELNVPHCQGNDDLSVVKWTNEKTDKKTDLWPLVDQLLSEADKFSNKLTTESQVSNACTQELSKSDIKVYNVIFPYCFTKDIFKKLRVLGQLDNKFIVTVVSVDPIKEVIVLFDQHAVHERIRVENLTAEYQQHDGSALWKSASVDPALPLTLSSIEVRILESYMNKMNSLGFFFSVTDSTTVSVQRVPTCLLLRENREVTSRGVSVLRQHLESLVREQVDSLLNTRGVGTDHPTIIQNVINSEACRGAVKFGHPLTVADCQAFLHNLSSCNLPFQCAHGRPALVPTVDISQLKQKTRPSRPNLQKLKRIL